MMLVQILWMLVVDVEFEKEFSISIPGQWS